MAFGRVLGHLLVASCRLRYVGAQCAGVLFGSKACPLDTKRCQGARASIGVQICCRTTPNLPGDFPTPLFEGPVVVDYERRQAKDQLPPQTTLALGVELADRFVPKLLY